MSDVGKKRSDALPLPPPPPAGAKGGGMPVNTGNGGFQPQIVPARAFRVVISTLHRVSFVPSQSLLKGRDEARLSNISTSGIGLVAGDFTAKPKVKSSIEGSMVFEDGSHPVQMQVMHVTSGVIGAKFMGDSKGLQDAIRKYFELELLALGMLKVNPAHHKTEADGNAHWIHGDQCELFYVTNLADQVIRFRLTFLGNRFVWSQAGGLNVGQVIDDRVGIMRTDRIAVMESTPELTDLAVRFLLNIPQIPQEHRRLIGKAIAPAHAFDQAA
jgi:hypothetical protein